MDITIEHLGNRVRDGLAWYAEKLIPGALDIHKVKTVLIEFLARNDEDSTVALPAYSCRVRVSLADGSRFATESTANDGVTAIYDAVDRLKSLLSPRVTSNGSG